MASFLEHAYSIVHQDNTADQPTTQELKQQLEKGSDDSKVDTMKRILTIMINGDPMPLLLMHIIRFVMPSKSKPLKKLLYLYYEICPKLDAAGKLKQEMILVWSVCRFPSIPEYMELSCVAAATGSETTCNTRTSTFVAIPFAFCANFGSPNSSNLCYRLPGHVSNTDTPMFERMPSLPSLLYTNCPKPSFQMHRTSYCPS